jgi:glycosyltransferase involved in cell wall biosynthesis
MMDDVQLLSRELEYPAAVIASDAKVAVLTNCVPAYRVPLLEAFQAHVRHLRVFVNFKVVPGRDWHLFLDRLDIVVNRTLSRTTNFQNVHGFADESQFHVPWDVLWTLVQYRPDVIVTGEFGMRTIFACLYRVLSPRTRLILWATLSERTEATRGRGRETLRRWILSYIDGIFVNGHSGERYVRSLGFSGKPLAYIPHTVDNEYFLGPATRPAGDPVQLFFAGQLVERKGLYPFVVQLGCWCDLHPRRSVVAIVVGDGPELARLKTLSLPDNLRVEFPGTATSDQLPQLYRAADIYIFPTLADEWGVVVNEALIAGLPVLGSCHSQAVEELVADGVNGWVFDPGDERQVFQAIDRALTSDSETLDTMRRAAIDSVKDLTPQVIAERMIALIRQVHGN